MADRIACQNCGGRVELPDGFSRPKIRCPGCGYYAEVPTEMRSPREPEAVESEPQPRKLPQKIATAKAVSKARPKADPRDTRPDFELDEPSGVPLLAGTQDEDDDKPYAVPGTGMQNCPHCRGDLPLSATFCVHCGKELSSGSKAARVHQPMVAEWVEGFALLTRYKILAGMQVLNFFGTLLALNAEGFTSSAIMTNLIFQVIHVALQAFIVGSFDTVNLKRNAKGQTTITRTKRIAFYPLEPMKIPWKKSTNLGIIGTHESGIVAWIFCIYLLMLGILPGVLFYWFVIHPELCQVNLCDVYGSTDEVLFRSRTREKAEEVTDFVIEATGLQIKKVM